MRHCCILLFASVIACASTAGLALDSVETVEMRWSSGLPSSLRRSGAESWHDVLVNSASLVVGTDGLKQSSLGREERPGITLAAEIDPHSTAIPAKLSVQSDYPVTILQYSDGVQLLVSKSYQFCSSFMTVAEIPPTVPASGTFFLILHFSTVPVGFTPRYTVSFQFKDPSSQNRLRNLAANTQNPAENDASILSDSAVLYAALSACVGLTAVVVYGATCSKSTVKSNPPALPSPPRKSEAKAAIAAVTAQETSAPVSRGDLSALVLGIPAARRRDEINTRVLASITAEAVQKATATAEKKEPPPLVEPTSPVATAATKPVAVRPRRKHAGATKKVRRAKTAAAAMAAAALDENPNIEGGQSQGKPGGKKGKGRDSVPVEATPLAPMEPTPPKKTKLVKRKKTGSKSAFKSIRHDTDADPTEV